jgi:DNA-directed RNA polymerase alpha subunit
MPFPLPELEDIPPKAMEAIIAGIEDDHPICNLEPLGISQRTINILEGAGIFMLENLMHTKKEELASLENLGPKGLQQIFKALAKYDEFKEEF